MGRLASAGAPGAGARLCETPRVTTLDLGQNSAVLAIFFTTSEPWRRSRSLVQGPVGTRAGTAPKSLISMRCDLLSDKQAAAVAGTTAAHDATETRAPRRNARRNIVDLGSQWLSKSIEWMVLATCKTLASRNGKRALRASPPRKKTNLGGNSILQRRINHRWVGVGRRSE